MTETDGEDERRMMPIKKKLEALGIAILIFSSGFMMLFLGSIGNWVSPASQIHVACIGDSLTEKSGYPENLQAMLGINYWVRNFGVSGSAVVLNSERPYMNQSAFRNAKAFQPSIVIIMLGTNDAHEKANESIGDFSLAYEKLIDEFEALEGNQQILLVKPPPIFDNDLGLNNTKLEQDVIPSIEQAANALSLPVIDAHATLIQHPEYFGDGVHLTNEGAMLLTSEIYQAVTSNYTDAGS
jgi:lysophospholipase L1-like esterase